MAIADTFTIDNVKTMIKLWMIYRKKLLEKEACTYRVMEGEEPSAKKTKYDYEETLEELNEYDSSIRLAKHSINSFSVSRFIPEYNMTLDELEMYLEDLDRRFNTLKELGDAHPIKRSIVNCSVRHTIANYDLKQARKDYEKLDDERRKVRKIISEIKESEEFINDYFEIELDEDESVSDFFSDTYHYVLNYTGKLSDEMLYCFDDEEYDKKKKELDELRR